MQITFNNYLFLNVYDVCYLNNKAGYCFEGYSKIINLQNNTTVQCAAQQLAIWEASYYCSSVQQQLAKLYASSLACSL
jgi:hypothetical protein